MAVERCEKLLPLSVGAMESTLENIDVVALSSRVAQMEQKFVDERHDRATVRRHD